MNSEDILITLNEIYKRQTSFAHKTTSVLLNWKLNTSAEDNYNNLCFQINNEKENHAKRLLKNGKNK